MMSKKRRIMKELKINEISSVDSPAQQGAVALIMKRDTPEELTEKVMILTSADEGHQHTVSIDIRDVTEGGGSTGYSLTEDAEMSHDHAFMINADGSITIAENNGHSHTAEIGELMGRLGLQAALVATETTVEVEVFEFNSEESKENAVTTKSEDNLEFSATDFALVPDPSQPSTWKYRLASRSGICPSRRLVGNAVTALKRGKVPSEHVNVVTRRVRKAWQQAHEGSPLSVMPPILKRIAR